MSQSQLARTPTRRLPGVAAVGALVALVAVATVLGYQSLTTSPSTASAPLDRGSARSGVSAETLSDPLPGWVWPAQGQAAFVVSGHTKIHAGPRQSAAPIASVAKVMTAYLVLRHHPLDVGQEGPTITLTDADVEDTDGRRRQEQSVVAVAVGEQLTERQALQALLLPSANNIAIVLARWDAGSVDDFVDGMNATARSLGMTQTHYTDPSGYDDGTVSTAADQVRIVVRAMRLAAFATIVATPSATLPVVGTVRNTDTLLGRDGFIGVKTGSDTAAGGCFAFQSVQWVGGKRTTITGVVLGQRGHNLIDAGLLAADAFVNRLVGHRGVPGLPLRR